MKVVSCLKDTELKISEIVTVEGINISVRILGTEDRQLYLGEIPSIYKDKTIFYTQIGSCLYIGTEDIVNSIIFIYVIEQEIKNNSLSIKNIYSDVLVGEGNILARFFKYDKEFQQENLRTRLINVIDEIPVIIEKQYLKEKIEQYLNEETQELEEQTNKIMNEYIKSKKKKTKYNQNSIEYDGKIFNSVNAFCREYKIKAPTYYYYKNKGYSIDEMIENIKNYKEKRKENVKKYVYEGSEMTLKELADFSEIKMKTLESRLRLGWTIEKAIETPVQEK